MTRFLLFLCLLLALAPRADAFSRANSRIGDTVRRSPLIVIADIATADAPRYQTTLTVREILKQDDASPTKTGELIELPPGITRYGVPQQARNALVMMAPDYKAPGGTAPWPILEVLQAPAQISAARALITVYEKPGERAQLLALQTLAGQGNNYLDEQLIADLGRMRERANFAIALDSFDRLELDEQAKLLQLLGTIGDGRALPLLIGALDASERRIWAGAAHQLVHYFPAAPGVLPALQKLASDDEKRPQVAGYLARYAPDFPLPKAEPTLWMRAEGARKNGELDEARTLYFAMLEAEAKLGWGTLSASRELLALASSDADKTRLRRWLVARLTLDAPNYYDSERALQLLRALPDAENAPALTRYLTLPDKPTAVFMWAQSARTATFALRELGAEARKVATASVVQTLKSRFAPGSNASGASGTEPTIYGCELVWLADDATWQSIGPQISADANRQIAALQPLRDAATSAGEARALAALLSDVEQRSPRRADLWVIQRLGELGEAVAVAPLLAELKRTPYSGHDAEFKRALLAIGGDAARDGALEMLGFPEPSQRALGLDVLNELPDFDVHPLLLKILDGDDVPNKIHAITLLGYVGTPGDLPVLAQLADFWTTDLAYQSRAADAIVGIRERFAPAA